MRPRSHRSIALRLVGSAVERGVLVRALVVRTLGRVYGRDAASL